MFFCTMDNNSFIKHLNTEKFHPVVPFDPEKDRIISFDLTRANQAINEDVLNDLPSFIHYINDLLNSNDARYGIGGYAEHRDIYAGSKVFDPKIEGTKPRRLHLGTDIWGKPYTAVMAPYTGMVHSFANNNSKGDYGATIILSHHTGTISFYTLYGHLSLNSLKDLQEGNRIEAGEVFAEFGIPAENGNWPPHLHFQIIRDIDSWKGDYPGVCAIDEKDKWLSNSPDPDVILQLNRYIS